MEKEQIDRVIANEREWRQHLLKQQETYNSEITSMKKTISDLKIELSTFKIRVFAFATLFGGVAGRAEHIKQFIMGG